MDKKNKNVTKIGNRSYKETEEDRDRDDKVFAYRLKKAMGNKNIIIKNKALLITKDMVDRAAKESNRKQIELVEKYEKNKDQSQCPKVCLKCGNNLEDCEHEYLEDLEERFGRKREILKEMK